MVLFYFSFIYYCRSGIFSRYVNILLMSEYNMLKGMYSSIDGDDL